MSIDRQRAFAALHISGDPLVLFNIWDAGSARAVAEAGAQALATGSWSVAAAHGFDDAEDLPLDLAIANLERIVTATDLPVTLDFEGGYATAPEDVAANVVLVVNAGAVGVNFEDRVIGGEGVHATVEQCSRIVAIRAIAGDGFFINARTDLFLQSAHHDSALLDAAIERASAYAEAGASGFFAPGLANKASIARLCEASPLPVNIMAFAGAPERARLADLGVARISHGPGPYRQAMAALTEAARAALSSP